MAIQDVHDVTALKLICDELNKPTLRRISEWKDNSHAWNYCLSDIQCMLSQNSPGMGFIYDGACAGVDVQFVSLKELPLPEVEGVRSEAAIAKFSIGDIDVSLVNLYIHAFSEFDHRLLRERLKECFKSKDEVLLVLGDFTDFSKHIGKFVF